MRFLLMAGLMVWASASFASRNDLINDALNKNLEERDQVTGTYKQNDSTVAPTIVQARTNDQRIPVVIQDELTSGSPNLRNYDNADRTYQEAHVEAHLDREVKDVDHSYDKDQEKPKSAVKALLDSEG